MSSVFHVSASEGFGRTGWFVLSVLLLGVLVALTFGFAATFYIALVLVPVVFAALLMFCTGKDITPGE